ncbi:hypothetical protein KDM41_17615, partial [bacterium]|nr:hypothetical protein [bacterium]
MSIARVIYPFLLIAALLSATAHAEWSNEFGPTGFGSSSRPEAVVDYGGQLVVAGRFSNAGRDRVEKVARWDGSRWIQLGSGPRNISCLAVYGGSLVAGGSFAALDSMFSSGLARWDGEGWRGLPGGLAGDVHALVVFEGGLYVGGRFALEAGSTIRHLARWDGQRWHAVGHGIAGGGRTRVEALAVHDGSLIVGGVFNRAGTADAMNLAAWDGAAWRSFGEGPDDVVSAIQGHGDRLYIGGSFNNVSGVAATSVACWSGGQWSGMSGGLGREYQTRPEVNAMVVWREKLIVGGRFDSAGGRRARAIASWDGSAWQSELPEFFTSPTYPGQLSVADLMVFGGRLVAVGEIPGGEGFLLNNLGLWDGKRWDPLVTGQGVGGGLMELKRLADQIVLECGTGAGARNVFGPAVWGDGQWEPYPGPAAGSPGLDVDLKLITEVGDRVVGFGRMPVGNPPERRERPELAWHLAQWDGGRWAPTSPRSPFGLSWAHGAVAFRDTVCVFGDFSEGDDRDYPGLLFDGDAWRPISRPDPAASLRRTVVVGDRLYAAWTVKSVGDTLRGLVTVLNGTNWSVLKATEHCEPTALGGWGAELVVAVSDPFEMMSESTRIQAWNGREWRPVPGDFRGRAGRPGGIDALAGYKGHLVASGIYAGIDGVACRNVGWWDGELWRPLEGGVSYQAYRMVATENSLWLAGSFKEAGDFPSEHVARWDGPLPVPEVLPAFEPETPVVPQRKASAASASPEVEEVPGLFANGEFRAWTDSTPAHWRWQARAGSGCELPVIGPVRALEGGVTIQSPACGEFAATLSQIFEIARGATFRVRARYSLHGAADQTERRRAMLVLGDYKVSPDGKRSWSEHSQSHTSLQNGADNFAEIVLRTAPEATQASVDFSITGEDLALTVHEVTVEVIP